MNLYLLDSIRCSFEVISFYAGFMALSMIFAGRPFESWSTLFLQVSLICSVIEMLFPVGGLQFSRATAMVTVYIASTAFLAWQWFHLTRTWGLIFALGLMGVLCLEFLVAIHNLLYWLSSSSGASQSATKSLFLITEFLIAVLFATMAIFAMRRYWNKSRYYF